MTRPPEEELDRLDETHLDEEAEEASRRVRHAPRFQRVRRPETGAQPGSAAWQARLAALATPAPEGFAVDLVRSGGPRVASLDGDPLVALDAGEGVLRSPRGYQPGPAVRAHAEGGFGAALTGDDGVRARAEEAAFAAWLRARSPEHPHVAFLPSVAAARDLALTAAQRLRPEAPLALALEGGAELGVPVERYGAPASIPGEAPAAPAGWAEAAGRGELGAFADAPGLGETVRALEAIDARLGARPDVYALHVEPLQEATERWLGSAFLAGLRAVAARRRVALIVDEVGGGFGAGAVGRLALHAEAMAGLAPPELVVFGGAAQVGVVVGVDPLPPARDRAHPAALFRGRLTAEALGRHTSDLECAVRERLERLAGRFAIVSGVRAAGRAFAFELPTAAHAAALRAQAPARGALPLAGSEAAPRTVRYRLGERWGERELDALFDALRATLKYLEARLDAAGEGPAWEPEPPPPKAARRPPIDAPTRVRAVPPAEAEAMLDAVVGLEARVYEPARRDSKEKLGLAFRDPAGVAVVAEAERDGAWELVGCALGAPLERIEGVPGADVDRMRPLRNSLYALSTTLDPTWRGHGLGRRMKEALVDAAAAVRRPDGSPRYHYVCGRMRVGATGAMMAINAQLGATEVYRLERQYEGDAQATYYRMPLRGPVVVPARREAHAPASAFRLGRPERLLDGAPRTLRQLARRGGLEGPAVHGLPLGLRPTPPILRALEHVRALVPAHPRVHVAACLGDAVEAARRSLGRPAAAAVVGLEGGWLGELGPTARALGPTRAAIPRPPTPASLLPHPAADLEGAREALEALADQPGGPALAALFLEPLQRRTGRRVPDPFWAALEDWRAATGVPVVLVESASAGWRSGAGPLLASELPFAPDRLVWAAGRVAFAHAPEDAPFPAAGWDADPLALVQAHHALRAARDLALDGLVAAARLEDALAPLREAGAEERGTGALRFAVLGDAAGPVAALLEARGIHPARVGGVLRFAPPLDAPPERFDALQTALERAAREHLS